MLLGIARTAALAGWGTVPPSARTTVTTTTANSAAFPTTPRNYIDNPAVFGTGSLLNLIPPSVSAAVDQTGITTNGKQCTWAWTIQYGTNYLTTAPSDGTPYGAIFYDRFNISGTGYFPAIGAQVTNGVYAFNSQITASGSGFSATFNNFNSLRNTWLGIVVSASDTSTSFANWTGGTGTSYQRLVISDIATGAILQQTDSTTSNTLYDRSLTNQYYYDPAYAATYNYQPFWFPAGVASPFYFNQYYMSDFNLASQWINWGVALDPAVYYASLTGSAVNTTVAGQKAWYAYNSDNGSNSATGYSFNIPTGPRVPTGGTVTSDNFGSGAAAQLVAF